jgi:hypothetical protein
MQKSSIGEIVVRLKVRPRLLKGTIPQPIWVPRQLLPFRRPQIRTSADWALSNSTEQQHSSSSGQSWQLPRGSIGMSPDDTEDLISELSQDVIKNIMDIQNKLRRFNLLYIFVKLMVVNNEYWPLIAAEPKRLVLLSIFVYLGSWSNPLLI